MVARANFVQNKARPLIPLSVFEPQILPKGEYILSQDDREWPIECRRDGDFNFVAIPGFFQLLRPKGLPTITISGNYIFDEVQEEED